MFLGADVPPEHRLCQRSSIVRAKPTADDRQLPVNSAAASAVLTSPGQSQPSVSTPAPELSSTVLPSTVPHPRIATSSSVLLHSLVIDSGVRHLLIQLLPLPPLLPLLRA